MSSHAEASEKFIADAQRTDWHDETLWFVREKRDKVAMVLPEWEALRQHAEASFQKRFHVNAAAASLVHVARQWGESTAR